MTKGSPGNQVDFRAKSKLPPGVCFGFVLFYLFHFIYLFFFATPRADNSAPVCSNCFPVTELSRLSEPTWLHGETFARLGGCPYQRNSRANPLFLFNGLAIFFFLKKFKKRWLTQGSSGKQMTLLPQKRFFHINGTWRTCCCFIGLKLTWKLETNEIFLHCFLCSLVLQSRLRGPCTALWMEMRVFLGTQPGEYCQTSTHWSQVMVQGWSHVSYLLRSWPPLLPI